MKQYLTALALLGARFDEAAALRLRKTAAIVVT